MVIGYRKSVGVEARLTPPPVNLAQLTKMLPGPTLTSPCVIAHFVADSKVHQQLCFAFN